MKKESIWLNHIHTKVSPPLKKGITTDVLIIGGGIAGISTAFELRNKNINIALIEQYQVGYGSSGHTTGKLTFLQELIYQKLESNFGSKISDLYLSSQREAIEIVKKNVIDFNIDCNFEGVSSYVFTNDLNEIEKFQKEEFILARNKIPYKIKTKLPIEKVKYAIEVQDTAVFHPVKYIQELKKIILKSNISIYEKTKALSIKKTEEGFLINTEEGYINTKHVVICTHYPSMTIKDLTPLRTHIERSYLCAGKTKNKKKFSAITSNLPTKSLRYHEDKEKFMLYVGQSHKLGDNLDYAKNYQELINESTPYIKEIDYVWQNQDIITNDSLPLIGPITKSEQNIIIATGFHTWGMTNGVIAGKIISDHILGKYNPYKQLFSPYRTCSIDSIKNFTIDSFQTGKNYIISHLKNYYSFYLNEVIIRRVKGKKVGIYIDEDGCYHIVSRTCPHLKCALTFNMFMKTWDCPCHGSRFDIEGNCIEGPSVYNIKF